MMYSVRSLKMGEAKLRGPQLFWMSDWEEWHPVWFQTVLVQGDGITALINTGPPEDLSILNTRWKQRIGERAGLSRRDDEYIVPALAKLGVSPTDVTHVLLTPLQLYSTENIPLFTNAQICLAKRGWVHYHTSHDHPHDDRWSSISKQVLQHLVIDAWDRVHLLEDEDEVAPGLRTWWSGVHHRASMVVEIDTAVGVVAVSDSFFTYENVEDGRLLGINENMYEALTTNRRVMQVADHIIPLYDPKVFNRYRDGVVA